MLRSFLQPIRVKTLIHTQHRTFSTTLLRLSQETQDNNTIESEEEQQQEPIKLSRRRRRFHEWAQSIGSRYTRPAEGTTNYLGMTPFPKNPLFQPRPPLSDAKREEIYQLYVSDPEVWTIRQLAGKFGYSLKRVEAILKLKASEKEMEASGIPLQRQFTKGMEQYMGADQPAVLLQEPLIDIFPNVSKPRFKLIEEDAEFTSKDAANVLNRKPYKLLEKQSIALEEAKFKPSATQSQDNTSSSKKASKFVIVDTSSQ
ncbi:eukaryotic mitochondrial regulator protein-domain-containing protein [Halteromyces radiatus]|uniref:eukaryotic mitochondrial regulator protein-domain-containing protein n=1 Tax=Halteromyces radiatus TaxID=101107 RepID=UPI00222020D3|nr:eukaryotic mitochondrial regulator protein-domain-containing protein [Halteromyces radiatus]KAI8084459.1 eukaryotic mitochondrial regulator protein-domain-containing protein [Halteromyces radiatus]